MSGHAFCLLAIPPPQELNGRKLDELMTLLSSLCLLLGGSCLQLVCRSLGDFSESHLQALPGLCPAVATVSESIE